MHSKRRPACSRARTDPKCLVTPSLLAYWLHKTAMQGLCSTYLYGQEDHPMREPSTGLSPNGWIPSPPFRLGTERSGRDESYDLRYKTQNLRASRPEQ